MDPEGLNLNVAYPVSKKKAAISYAMSIEIKT